MDRDEFYDKIPTDLLSCFYFYIKKKIIEGVQFSEMTNEIQSISLVAKKRRISLTELYIRGSWIDKNEINQTIECLSGDIFKNCRH